MGVTIISTLLEAILLVGALVGTMIVSSVVNASDINLWRQSTLSQILKRGVLGVGLDAGYMPFEMEGSSGKLVGFDIDMAKDMGVEVKFVNTSWSGIISSLLTGKFDLIMSGMTITQKRNLKINFANPYFVMSQSILIRKGLTGKIKSYKEIYAQGT